MERKSTKRKHFHQHLGRLHGKYKRYAAVVAGAAIMAGFSSLPGMPAAKALAAENPSAKTAITQKKVITDHDREQGRNDPPGRGWHEHDNSWPSSDENQAWSEDGRIYYRSDKSHDRNEYAHYLSNPVDFVKQNADFYGFDPYLDSFKLLSLTNNKALVEVRRHDTGRLFDVLLQRTSDRDWQIVETRAL